jgi:hypothetical protein
LMDCGLMDCGLTRPIELRADADLGPRATRPGFDDEAVPGGDGL